MTTRIVVINRALVKLGVNTIASPDDNNEQARKAALIFDTLAQAEMRRHAWSFAIKRTALPALPDPPAYGFTTSFQLPTDCLRLVSIGETYVFQSLAPVISGQTAPYAIEGRKLNTNDGAPLYIRYVADVSADASVWDASFIEAFAVRLALELCATLTKSSTKKQDLKQDYAVALFDAKRCNAIELPSQQVPDDSWVQARFM